MSPMAPNSPVAPPSVAPPTVDDVMAVLGTVIDPELGADIVSLGMVPSVDVQPDGLVTVGIKLTIGGCPLRAEIKKEVETRVSVHPGVSDVKISWGEMNAEERSAVMTKARWNARENAPDTEVPLSCKVLAIASGKGGVGKSSVTVNLAAALAAAGHTVGVLDADIWGFSVPRLLGISERMEAAAVEGSDKPKIIPNERVIGEGLLKVVSTGFLVDEETALMWRGLMLTKAVEQFLRDVRWGELDYLLIDMPPGHRRRADGPGAHAAEHRSHRRHDAGARRAEGCAARGGHGAAQLPQGDRRDREHELVHLRPRRVLRAVRRGGRAGPRERDRCAAPRAGPTGGLGRRRRRRG